MSIFLGGAMGPLHPVWGHVLVSWVLTGAHTEQQCTIATRSPDCMLLLPIPPPRVDSSKECHPDHRLEIWEPGNPEIWNPTKISEMEILKIQIHVAQNVDKVWISRKKNLPTPFGAIPGNFLHGPNKITEL